MRWAWLVCALLSACVADQHDEAHYGRRSVYIAGPIESDGFASSYVAAFVAQLPVASRLGPTFARSLDRAAADTVVVHWDAGDCSHGAAAFDGVRTIHIDPVCSSPYADVALLHELGHSVGMAHVCRSPSDAAQCSPVGYGRAVMNPALTYGAPADIGIEEAFAGDDASLDWTTLDLQEYRRVHP